MLHLVFVRSPHASARIRSIEVDGALRVAGAVAALTAGDLDVLPVWEIALIPEEYAQPPLATGVVRYVGERVVAVVATSFAAAVDAAEQVAVDYEPGPARRRDVCLEWPSDADADGGDVRVVVEHRIPRVCVAPMEGHAVLAVPGPGGRLTVHASTQVPSATRTQLARSLGMDPADVRVVTPAVGGGFGGKAAGGVGEHVVAAAAARRLGRPVRYVEDRAANLLGMQGRGVSATVELHATRRGELSALRADITCDAGAYPTVGAVEPGKTRLMACGPYRIRVADVTARAVVTHLPPVGAYRGPGRSEASIMLERTLDVVASDLGLDPVDIRRRNVLRPGDMPYRAPTGVEYDSGDYPGLLDRLEEVSGYRDLRARRRDSSGPACGVGVALVVDSTAWFSRREGAAVSLDGDGTVVVAAGSAPAGQRHADAYRAIVGRVLPVDPVDIRVVEGDTDAWAVSDGTMGSRTTQLAGTAVLRAAEAVAAELRELAAAELEAGPADIVGHPGRGFGVRGVPSSARPLRELVRRAGHPLEATCVHEQPGATYPSAAHLSVVEVDLETGRVTPVRHVAVTDAGRIVDPVSAHGQVVGATAQGIAQALYEEAVFDELGNLRTASFADYAIPAAAELPPIDAHFVETPSPLNPLGAKGIGEIGMLAAPVAVQNAVVDALRPMGVRHLDMPCTPQRVWDALRRQSTSGTTSSANASS